MSQLRLNIYLHRNSPHNLRDLVSGRKKKVVADFQQSMTELLIILLRFRGFKLN